MVPNSAVRKQGLKTKTPLISIVIANYNYGRFLGDAIQSIINQDMGDDVELIICDGGSTDNSVDVIRRYANGLPPNMEYDKWRSVDCVKCENKKPPLVTWWCSEKDGGQSAAFNKGFSHAKGLFLTWLNADDIILPLSLKKLKVAISKNPDCEWFGGGCLLLDPNLRIFKCAIGRSISPMRARYGAVGVAGPSSFFSRDLYVRVGGIDERYHYTMDTDLWVRFAVHEKAKYKVFTKYAWGLRLHPQAKMSGHKFTRTGEILEGRESRVAFLKDKKRLQKIRAEELWTRQKIGVVKGRMPLMKRIISLSFVPALRSRLETWLLRGKPLEAIKGEIL